MGPTESPVIERRQHPRASYRASALVSSDRGALGQFTLEDVSLGGARLVGNDQIEVGTAIDLQLTSGELSGICLRAEVVRSSSEGKRVGVRFSEPPTRIESMIQEVVLSELAKFAA